MKALETLYKEGGPNIQSSSRALLKNFYLSSPETKKLLLMHLKSKSVKERRYAVCVLYGIIARESPEMVEQLCDKTAIQHVIDGLSESIADLETAVDPECTLHRHEAIHLLLSIIQLGNRASANRFMNELLTWFAKYEALARKSKGKLPRIIDLSSMTLKGFRTEYCALFNYFMTVYIAENPRDNDWRMELLKPTWRAVRKVP